MAIEDLIKRFKKEKPAFEDILLLLLEQAQKGGEDAVKATLRILVKHKLVDLKKFVQELEDLVEKLVLMGKLTPPGDYYNKRYSNFEEEKIEKMFDLMRVAMTKVSQTLEKVFEVISQSLYTLMDAYSAAGTSELFGPPYENSKERKSIERFIKQAKFNFTDGENGLSDYFAGRYYMRYLIRRFKWELDEDRIVKGEPGSNSEKMQMIINILQKILDRTKELYIVAKEIYPGDQIAKAWIEYAGLHKLIPELERNIKNLQASIEELRALKRPFEY